MGQGGKSDVRVMFTELLEGTNSFLGRTTRDRHKTAQLCISTDVLPLHSKKHIFLREL
jgi:hypothetical protein